MCAGHVQMPRGALTRGFGIVRNRVMRGLLVQLIGRAIVLGAIGPVAIGVSSGVAAAFGITVGKAFVAGDQPGVTYSRARCADFFEYSPHARSCEQAATEHHYGEVVEYRVAAGVFGLVILGASEVVRRRRPEVFGTDCLPVAFGDTVAATAFTVGGIGLIANGIDLLALGNNGDGNWLSSGIVASLAAIGFGTRFLHRVAFT